ncbi:MAG TPA: DUF4172 domain-containing protein [Gammaproteobacteria bacterium]|nr:DUF4172 domain-containing protein [Gammaproteobacteria bacterium]
MAAGMNREQGRLPGKMEAPGFDLRCDAHLRTLTEDIVKSSEMSRKRRGNPFPEVSAIWH